MFIYLVSLKNHFILTIIPISKKQLVCYAVRLEIYNTYKQWPASFMVKAKLHLVILLLALIYKLNSVIYLYYSCYNVISIRIHMSLVFTSLHHVKVWMQSVKKEKCSFCSLGQIWSTGHHLHHSIKHGSVSSAGIQQ